MTKLRRRLHGGDGGMTLVELLVYMILLTIVLAVIASVLISSLQKQREVVRISQANDTGQTIASAVDLAVLNAATFTVKPGPGKSVLLITKTRSTLAADDPNVARCVGFYYDDTTKQIHTASDMLVGSGTPRTKSVASNLAGAADWPVLAQDIEQVEDARVFAVDAADPSKLDLTFEIQTLGGKPPATFRLTSGVRGSGAIDNPGSCW